MYKKRVENSTKKFPFFILYTRKIFRKRRGKNFQNLLWISLSVEQKFAHVICESSLRLKIRNKNWSILSVLLYPIFIHIHCNNIFRLWIVITHYKKHLKVMKAEVLITEKWRQREIYIYVANPICTRASLSRQ